MTTVTLKGNPVTVAGQLPKAGAHGADFTLVNKELQNVSLEDFAGKRKVLNIVPSLDTPDLPEIHPRVQREGLRR